MEEGVGCNKRSLVETAIGRYKAVIGDVLRLRKDERRTTEVAIAVHILNLPATYPMTASNYAERRSELAVAIGLGRKPSSERPVPVPVQRVKAGVSGKRGRGRPRKTAA